MFEAYVKRKRWIELTVEERKLANELHNRASKLRDEVDDISITQSVKLAAIQMGLEMPDEVEEEEQ